MEMTGTALMEKGLIIMNDREEVLKELGHLSEMLFQQYQFAHDGNYYNAFRTVDDAIDILKSQPDIVRCKDCVYHHYDNDHIPYCERIDYGYGWKDDDFCSRGERR